MNLSSKQITSIKNQVVDSSNIAAQLIAQGRHPNVLITGVSTGMGYESARMMLANGVRVFGSVRKRADAERLRDEFGSGFTPLLFDVSDHPAIENACQQVVSQLQGEGLAAVVNNAGVSVVGPLMHLDIDDIRHQFEVNTFGALKVVQTFLPLLGAQRPNRFPPGKIINISSVSGFLTGIFSGAYAMSKHALESMSDALRRELSIYGIDVLVIQPGAVATAIHSKNGSDTLDPKLLATDFGPMLKAADQILAASAKNALPASVIGEKIIDLIVNNQSEVRHLVAPRPEMMTRFRDELSDRELDEVLTKPFRTFYNQ